MKKQADRKASASRGTGVLEFRNRQRTRSLDLRLLRRIASDLLERELWVADYEIGFHLVDPVEMASVNEHYLQHEGSTDVITFDHGSSDDHIHGEAFICIADAVMQAKQFRTTWQSELVRYVIHALLHLRGFDDLEPEKRREMKRHENRLLRSISARHKLSHIARRRAPEFQSRKAASRG